jgi:hypothetical protein
VNAEDFTIYKIPDLPQVDAGFKIGYKAGRYALEVMTLE